MIKLSFETQWFDANWLEEANKEKSEEEEKHIEIKEDNHWKDYAEMLKLEVYMEDYNEAEEED